MKYSVLSIPGLPSSFGGLDSKVYHNPYPFLEVLRELYGSEASFDVFQWAGRDVALPTSRIMRWIPLLHLFAVYSHYSHSIEYRERILEAARVKIKKQLLEADVLFVISHSHGNKVFMDAMKGLRVAKGKKIVWLGQAPAFNNVLYGFAAPKVRNNLLKSVISRCELTAFFMVRTDVLAGDPGCDQDLIFKYKPKLYEYIFLAHDTVRKRNDVLNDLRRLLKKNI